MLLIKNGYVKTMASEDIENGSILIGDDGKILAVGKDITAPDGAEIIDAEGRLVTPGIVEAHCHIGLCDVYGSDVNEAVSPILPEMRAIDGIDPLNEHFTLALKDGITTACIGPGSISVIGGTFTALKTFGKRVDDMIIKDPVAMKVAFGENPVKYYGKDKKSPASRLGVAALLREFLFKAKHYYEAKISGKDPAFDFKLESMLPVMSREIPLKIHAHRSDDIFTAIRIAKEFNLKYMIDHCTDGILFSEELAKENIPVCVGPSMGKKSKPELLNKSFKNPATLNAAGVKIAIVTDATVMPIDYLTLCAGLAVSVGLPEEDAWRAITISPAEIMGIADRVGSLEVGKDGNVAIWNHNPLKQIGLETYLTIGEGKVVYKAE